MDDGEDVCGTCYGDGWVPCHCEMGHYQWRAER